METYWGDPYGIPEGPWETFAGPPPNPPMEHRCTNPASGWNAGWHKTPDARTLYNILEHIERGNFHGYELREAS